MQKHTNHQKKNNLKFSKYTDSTHIAYSKRYVENLTPKTTTTWHQATRYFALTIRLCW